MTFQLKALLNSGTNLVRSFLHLPLAQKRLLIRALFLVWMIRLGLLVLRFNRLRRLATSLPAAEIDPSFSLERLIWAVEIASQFVPGAKCLARAMAAQLLLSEHGHRAELRIGVAKSDNKFQAHAWLEDEGKVLIGGPAGCYTPLLWKELIYLCYP